MLSQKDISNKNAKHIVEKNGINLADLMEANDINSIVLMPGTTINVPVWEDSE